MLSSKEKFHFCQEEENKAIAFIWWREYEDSVATFFTYNNQLFSPIKQKVKERNKESIVLGRICKKKKRNKKVIFREISRDFSVRVRNRQLLYFL